MLWSNSHEFANNIEKEGGVTVEEGITMRDLEEAVAARHVQLLQYVLAVAELIGEEAFRILARQIGARRVGWLREHKVEREAGETLVRFAYRILLLEYMGLDSEEVLIVEETPTKIVFHSFNFCPVLEACQTLGLDTRRICKVIYEPPVQVFLDQIDPRLRFARNYDRIRPHAGHCEETIELVE